ncbi:hypothetical protein [Rhodococcus kronopolitis]|uniref:Uncharacterized protein n=1 Tax=Rhodococcus kronopolitis TaxID=1460226 RepID=A0ABV9FMW3_9NOCA
MSVTDSSAVSGEPLATEVDHLLGCRGAGVVVVVALIVGGAVLVGATTGSVSVGLVAGLCAAAAAMMLCRACRVGETEVR